MSEKISVSFAVYGIPSRILREGLDCLKRQTYQNAEFLLINDQSPDDYTIGILEEYAAEDSRFRVINNEENMGIAGVRNVSLEAASGKYFTIIDPDDIIPDNYLEIMCGVMEHYNADMVTCDIRNFNDGEVVNFQNDIKIDRYLTLPRPLKTRKLYRQKFVCRIFNLETIGDLRFERLLARGSDLLFIHQYLLRCERTVDIKFPGYFYRHGRIFSDTEKVVPRRNNRNIPQHFYGMTRITIDGFAKLFDTCKTDEERSFVSYMVIRRFMRSAFGDRKLGAEHYDELYENIKKHYAEVVQRIAVASHKNFEKMMNKIFAQEKMCGGFFFKVQILRLLFELRYSGYHICKTFAGIKLKLKHVRG